MSQKLDWPNRVFKWEIRPFNVANQNVQVIIEFIKKKKNSQAILQAQGKWLNKKDTKIKVYMRLINLPHAYTHKILKMN
jgi:hypothetical protein